MNKRILRLLNGESDNHALPFLWQHGESSETIRKYMSVIEESGCRAVCIESRPHPDFCGPKWWQDMDVILEEAKNRNMKVWILDDSHFPTGYANGAMKDKPLELNRQSLCGVCLDKLQGSFLVNELCPPAFKSSMIEKFMMPELEKTTIHFDDDALIGVSALLEDGSFKDITKEVKDGVLSLTGKEGYRKVWLVGLSRNMGPRRNYVNMCDKESCQVQIEAVYEPHLEHYKEYFGNIIAGFFSDEPELGNGHLYEQGNTLGKDQDLPMSREIMAELENRLGKDWIRRIPALWENEADDRETSFVRYTYMDIVTRLVREDFSYLLGDWCRNHGVDYIGHLVEDNNQHARTGSSLGHYFRGLEGQDYAGIDDIGGQVLLQGEDLQITSRTGHVRDGEFYHFCLGKLGGSAAAIDPKKKNRAMCEVFGAYGWTLGVKLEKYLLDHFLVRGITDYVPHAFSMKAFPDPDCPPHFYAHGRNPQYPVFGQLIRYMNRTVTAMGNGRVSAKVGVLYHAEAEWMGDCMFCQKPARVLMENQIGFDFLPMDVFTDPDRYDAKITDRLMVNDAAYDLLLIPEIKYLPKAFSEVLSKVLDTNTRVLFVTAGEKKEPTVLESGETFALDCVELDDLAARVGSLTAISDTVITPKNPFIRTMYRKNADCDTVMLVNEGTEPYTGSIHLPYEGSLYGYDAWENKTVIVHDTFTLPAGGSLILFLEEGEGLQPVISLAKGKEETELGWMRSLCKGTDYPVFGEAKHVSFPDSFEGEYPDFSGYAAYETEIPSGEYDCVEVCVTEACDGVQLFVDGVSQGYRVRAPFVWTVPAEAGKSHRVRIEANTTLEREAVRYMKDHPELSPWPVGDAKSQSGITGMVRVRTGKAQEV